MAALAVVVLTLTGMYAAVLVDRQLALIQREYMPKVQAGPKLVAQLERLARHFQDAVAAQDPGMVDESSELKRRFFAELSEASAALSPSELRDVQAAVEDYCDVASDVSRRLIAGERGEQLLDAMSSMQTKQVHAGDVLRRSMAFDEAELASAFDSVAHAEAAALRVRMIVSATCLVLVVALSFWLIRGMLRSLRELGAGLERFGRQDFGEPIQIHSRDELGALAERANRMAESLQRLSEERGRSDWLKAGHAALMHELRGDLEPREVANRALRVLARYTEAPAALLYYVSDDDTLQLLGEYAAAAGAQAGRPPERFSRGEGLLGAAAQQEEIVLVSAAPAEYLRVRSGLGESAPGTLALVPLLHLGRVCGVLELAYFRPWSDQLRELLLSVRESLAISIEVARTRAAVAALLVETQRQAERLVRQEDALRSNNEELQAQSEKLLAANEELTTVSAYKSQFLANMSHELRTPLNSMLLLSSLLADNESKNLDAKQVEFCRTIHGAGKDLLALINQVLDLAKIEAGKQHVSTEPVSLRQLCEHARSVFAPVARDKGLELIVELDPSLPEQFASDPQRVQQILNNLLGNALKFTQRGKVTLRFGRPAPDVQLRQAELDVHDTLAISVADTGVGIAPEHQERIFAPFEQAEASQDRRYGGTGLGLSIARELAVLLGGELSLISELGRGSTFTCYLPLGAKVGRRGSGVVASLPVPQPMAANDSSRPAALRACRVLLVEDDAAVSSSLGSALRADDIEVERVASATQAVRALGAGAFDCMVLDLGLPDMDGVELLESIKAELATVLPVIVYTGRALNRSEASRLAAYAETIVLKEDAGAERVVAEVQAFAHQLKAGLQKNARARGSNRAPELRLDGTSVFVIEDDMRTVYALSALLRGRGAEVAVADNGVLALEMLREREQVDVVLLDLMLPELDGYEVLRRLRSDPRWAEVPVVVLTAKAMKGERQKCLDAGANDCLTKPVDSDRLLGVLHEYAPRPRRAHG
ncbi:MAG TPA: response regulator [Polyangiales bacterium]|nr:response regulator [Polyangiales bacterium]